MPTKHCQLCTAEAPCGKSHVYVIELDPQVMDAGLFRSQNPHLAEGATCFYVGSSSHSPQCRLRQHQLWGSDAPSFPCACFGEEEERSFAGTGAPGRGRTRGARKAIARHSKYLCGRRFRKDNPLDSGTEAKDREVELAQELRASGFGVYQR